eukprot:UN13934
MSSINHLGYWCNHKMELLRNFGWCGFSIGLISILNQVGKAMFFRMHILVSGCQQPRR